MPTSTAGISRCTQGSDPVDFAAGTAAEGRPAAPRPSSKDPHVAKSAPRPPKTDDDVQRDLQALPRNASPTRVRNRDVVDGRPRSVYRRFGLSRVRLREMAHAGELPGVTKSSW